MKIIVTGSESFVGRELIRECIGRKIQVFGIDLAYRPSQDYEYKKIDIRSLDVSGILPDDAQAIVHLAAIARWTDCSQDLKKCFDVNVLGTINIIDAANSKKIPSFIFASSEFVYGESPDVKTEESPILLESVNSYGLSKLVIEDNLKEKTRGSGMNVAILRFGIIYGPRESNWSAAESLFNSVKTQNKVEVGSLATGRNFIHVSDIASGILKALDVKGLEIFNLAGSKFVTLADLIETSKKILGKNPEVKELGSKPSTHKVSSEKARRVFGWTPVYDIEKGLRTLDNA